MIQKILIANRGEIAVRIIRSCREAGIKSVAVYSDADRTAPHVLKADEAYRVGPAPSSESYLNVEAILSVIKQSGADAVHPGYGFLSENADFADLISSKGITWIGPSSEAIRIMGDKMAARNLAEKVKAPIVPGTTEPIKKAEEAVKTAESIGYPILVKAAGGGGGKGMRIVNNSSELSDAFDRARSEAEKAFSDDRVYIEKYLEEPHHIEIQVFADSHGNVVSLAERECSVQRRYQKIIEETPSPFVTPELRKELKATAKLIAQSCDYTGAGTVEFLVDKYRNYYFLEMNTRLQVEHPITEMVTGVDLVREQIRVANGKKLSFEQDKVSPRGHSIECRLYAEDGLNNFTPSTGLIEELDVPHGLGVRLDDGVRAGQEITPYYDPLLGKLITWGKDRDDALNKMLRALEEFHIVGIDTTIPFCYMILQHETFAKGQYCTKTLDEIKDELISNLELQTDQSKLAAGIGAIRRTILSNRKRSISSKVQQSSAWAASGRKENLR